MNKSSGLKLPYCPYCKTRLLYVESLAVRNRCTYKCPSCKKKSDIVSDPLIFKFLGVIQLIALAIFVLVVFLECWYCLIGIIFITLVFGIFYVFSPYMVKLEPKVTNKPKKKR